MPTSSTIAGAAWRAGDGGARGLREVPGTADEHPGVHSLDDPQPLQKNRANMQSAIPAKTRRRRRIARRRRRIERRWIETCALIAALALGPLAAGCALLVPPAWRSRAPIPLAGPLEVPSDRPAASDPTHDEALAGAVETDRQRLVEIVSDPARAIIGEPGEEELREIASRLPRLQNELDARPGAESGSRIRHPVIR